MHTIIINHFDSNTQFTLNIDKDAIDWVDDVLIPLIKEVGQSDLKDEYYFDPSGEIDLENYEDFSEDFEVIQVNNTTYDDYPLFEAIEENYC